MGFKKRLFGYSVREVESRLSDYENLIDLQKRDIEFLKRDNALLKNTLSQFSTNENTRNG